MQRRQFMQSSLFAAAATFPGINTLYAAVRAGGTPDIVAVSGDGREITLRGKDIEDLAARLGGTVLLAGDAGYDEARFVRNPSFDKHPALIVQPVSDADVQAAVKFARANGVLLAVKCGGHSHSGQSTCERGMQIDLQKLRTVRVDAASRRVAAAGGALLGQVDRAATAQGLVTPLGTVSHTGVGGLTLGGGFGRLARRFGMAIDNLAAVDVVTADGNLLHASTSDNPDLFWGVRGGGGNFGVATRFEFHLHPMQRQVVAGRLVFPLARARDALDMWAEYAPAAPDDLYIDPVLELPPGNAQGYLSLEVCYSGSQVTAERVLAPLRKLGKPTHDTIKAKDYVEVQRANDSTDSRAIATYLKGGFIPSVPKDLVKAIVEGIQGDPRRATVLFFQHCGGASSRVADGATAFAHRYAVANMMAVSAYALGAQDATPHIEATRRYWKTLEPFTQGFYVNDLAREVTAKQLNDNYRGNYDKLLALKRQYDPTNLFRLNANITA